MKENEMNHEGSENTDVEIEIEAIRQQFATMGANDSEFSELDSIKESWRIKEISGVEAVTKAQSILNNKQDYH